MIIGSELLNLLGSIGDINLQKIIKIELEVSGQPVGKGRPRFTKTGQVYTPPKTREYEQRIHASAWAAMKEQKIEPTEKFVHLEVTAFMEIPKSWSKIKQLEAEYGVIKPTCKPDLDNIVKSVGDGLENVVYYSDKQVTSINAKKVYCHPEKGAVLYVCISWTE